MRHSLLPISLLWLAGAWGLAVPAVLPTSPAFVEKRVLAERDDEAVSDLLTTYSSSDIIPTTETVKVSTSPVPTGTALLLPSLSDDIEPQTTGVAITEEGFSSPVPLLITSIPSPTSLLQPIKTTTTKDKREAEPTEDALVARQAANIFSVPIGTAAPPSMIKRRSDHPVPRTGVVKSGPTHTNKFYNNLFLGTRTAPVYTFPYAVSWAKGTGATASWGMSISHIEPKQWIYGPVEYNNAVKYYINPVGIQSMVLSAKELGKDTTLTVDSMSQFHARVMLRKNASSSPLVYFNLVQGMAYVTGRFEGGTPIIQSGVYFRSMTKVATDPKSNVRKYNFLLEDGTTWRVYAYRTKGDPLDLKVTNNGLAQASKPFYGLVQITKDPKTTGSEKMLDDGAGIYPTGGALSGSVSGSTGTYTISYTRSGHATGNLYMYALPHHVASFNADTKSRVQTAVKLQTPTKGVATAVKGTSWTMVESGMATGLGFGPFDGTAQKKSLSAAAKAAIKPIALSELSQDMKAQTNLDSMYFSGKALLKFAQLVYVFQELVVDKPLAAAGLAKLKEAFAVFGKNQQKYPLVYESAWGGIVSSASYVTGNNHDDFGNTYYNDHHFHWGYHILAAAYIASMDKAWETANKDYVNSLIRDIANPSTSDTWFPQYRSFDWYHGHSWAHGLYESLDGKNQESSSEDMMALYAIKQWGTRIGDKNMVARAHIQMAVLKRASQSYYLMTTDNKIQPAKFIGNKVAGVLHENKIDHTTFFSPDIEAIQGIHMIPVHGASAVARSKTFIQQEWNTYFSNGRVDKFNNAWKSMIYANYALVDPKKAWSYFNSKTFNPAYIDGGASRAWYMAYTAALGGA